MNRIIKKLIVTLVLTAFLTGCGESTESESINQETATTVMDESAASEETAVNDSIATKETTEETTQTENETPTPPHHMDATWARDHVGSEDGIAFYAPVSWKSDDKDETFAFYSPADENGEYIGYSISAGFNTNRNGNIEFFLERDLNQYDNVKTEEMEIAGCPATRLEYETSDEDGEKEAHITYYIQVHPELGLATLSYTAPSSDPDLYLDDFNKMVDSVELRGNSEQDEVSERTYILNLSTGVFHEPSCYKVKEIENAEEVTSTADELTAEGYEGCGICNPR